LAWLLDPAVRVALDYEWIATAAAIEPRDPGYIACETCGLFQIPQHAPYLRWAVLGIMLGKT
jgi:hypothetical protein